MNPVRAIGEFGQAVWLDQLRRGQIESGELEALIREDGVSGVLLDAAMLAKAIAGSVDYDAALRAAPGDLDPGALYEHLAVEDARLVADLLAPTHEATGGRDGVAVIEVPAHLARNAVATTQEARRLYQAVGRVNVLIGIPATDSGIAAIKELTAEGIGVAATLIFSRHVYEKVAASYLVGLEAFVADGGDPAKISGVAGFFLSRVDSAIDPELLKEPGHTVAIANAVLAYRTWVEAFSGPRWERLREAGARPQRLLWTGTSARNPRLGELSYVEALIGADTVTALSSATLDAFRERGTARATLTGETNAPETNGPIAELDRLGISFQGVADRLLEDGLRLRAAAFDQCLGAVARKREALLGAGLDRQSFSLPPELAAKLAGLMEEWREGGRVRRLWRRDPALWSGGDEAKWLGWLDIATDQLAHLGRLDPLISKAGSEDFKEVVLLGMGGSSLGPEVLGAVLGGKPLHILDSTVPAEIEALLNRLDLEHSLFIVSSKSGSTLETALFQEFCFAQVAAKLGRVAAGRRFVAVTDPGSKLEETARREGFRQIYFGLPTIGGRFSVLSDFGIVPAAAIGLDVARLLDSAEEMVRSCASSVPPADNPGVALGLALGMLAREGRDKVTLITTPGLAPLGAWLEQLIAESTGKNGKALIPVDGEKLAGPETYGDDRVFVHIQLEGESDAAQEALIKALEAAGQPVVRIRVADRYLLGQEFFRWEMAAAAACAVLGVNPFDQPDVEANKLKTKELTAEAERTGALPPEQAFLEEGGIRLFADPRNLEALGTGNLVSCLKAHLTRLGPGDYLAVLAFIARNAEHEKALQDIRHLIRDKMRTATCLGFGPRFLHSTGQAYKGGPNTGVILQITAEDARDVALPGRKHGFGLVKAAQARGDFDVLAERGRRLLRVHLGPDVASGLKLLHRAVAEALTES